MTAQLTLLACLVGLPWLLAVTVGDPLHGLGALRSGQVSDTVLIDLLTCLAYLCWAQFTLAVVAEAINVLHHWTRIASRSSTGHNAGRSMLPSPREPLDVPGPLRGQQQIAHRLVVAALMLTPVVTSFTLPSHLPALATPSSPIRTTAAVTASLRPDSATQAATATPGREATPDASTHIYVVPARGGPATYWDLAATYLGSGEQWEKIWQLNHGRTQADGSVMESPNLLRPGWTVIVPPTANPPTSPETSGSKADLHAVTVYPGDTLSGLAAADGVTDWTTVWPANQDRLEPDGQRFADPNQIRPGWSVLLPDQQTGPAHGSTPSGRGPTRTPPADHTPPSKQPPATPRSSTPTRSSPTSTTTPAPPSATRPRPNGTATGSVDPPMSNAPTRTQPASPASRPDAPASMPGSPSAAHAPGTGTEPAPASSSTTTELITVVFGGTGMLLGGLTLTALARHRRRQQRHRRPGRSITEPPNRLHAVERDLRTRPGVTSGDAQWLTHTLRRLADAIAARPDGQLPDVAGARLAPDYLELVLANPLPSAPAHWTVEDSGSRWRLPRAATLAEAGIGDACLPYPALTSVGVTTDGQWMLDLEQLRTLTIRGPAEQRRNLLRHMAAELAHNSWSDHVHVSLVGVGHELTPIAPARLSCHARLDSAIAQIRAHLAGIDEAAAENHTTILNGRGHAIAADAWTPHILIVDMSADAAVDQTIDPAADPASTAGPAPSRPREEHEDQTGREDLAALVAELDARSERCAVAVLIGVDPEEPIPAVASEHHTALPGTHCEPGVNSRGTGPARSAGPTMTITADARLSYPPLNLSVTACQLTVSEAADLTELLTIAADLTDHPMPDARGSTAWEQHADAAGAPRRPDTDQPTSASLDRPSTPERTSTAASTAAAATTTANDQAARTVDTAPNPGRHLASRPLLTLPDEVYLATTAATKSDLDLLTPPLPDMTREQIADSDTQLDADLAAWRDPTSTVPKLRLLGPITLTAPIDPPEGRAALITELIAYLITRPHGATVEELATAIWPHIPNAASKTTPRQSVSLARQWLAVSHRTRRERLPRASADVGGAKVYRITDVLVDADLFRRLRLRAATRGPDGIDDLQAALDLVTGAPFAQQRAGGYGWLADIPLHHEYAAMIVDVAHLVATHHLAAGNPAAAAAAARVSLLSEAGDDVALLDLLAAAEAEGNDAEARHYLQRIMANNDAEIEEDLPPRTYEILLRRGSLRHLTSPAPQ